MACYQCHNENTSLPDTQSEFNDNPTNPARSASIHPMKYDPSGSTPDFVECLKCHDQTKHMQKKVRLRKDPNSFVDYTSDSEVYFDPVANRTINLFCLECHGPGTTGGTFNRGGVVYTPPKLPAGHGAGAHFVNASLLCTDCHEYHGSKNKGLRKNARGDEETFCYNCHSDPAKSRNGVNIQAKFDGTASHHLLNGAEQAAKGAKVECEDCHNPHVVTRDAPVVKADDRSTAAVSDTAFCISCHDSTGATGVKFPGYSTGTSNAEWDPATGQWNKWNKAAYTGSQHDTLGNASCNDCHDPHGSNNHALILSNVSTSSNVSVTFGIHSTPRGKRREEVGVNKLCAACHKSAMGVYEGYAKYTSLSFGRKAFMGQTSMTKVRKGGVDKNCTYCHNPHGSAQGGMLRSSKPLYMNMTSNLFNAVYNFKGFSNTTTGKPYYTFCSSRSCHEGVSRRDQGTAYPPYIKASTDTFDMDRPVDNFTHDETKSSHHPIKEGVMGCTSCHYEHGSKNSPDLRAPYYRENRWPLLFKSGRGVYDTYRDPGYNYTGNIQFDGTNYFEKARSGMPDNTNRNKVTMVVPPDSANDLCFMCHQKDDIIGTAFKGMTGTNTRFRGHEAVKGGARVSRNISRDAAGSGDYHNFSCSACHFPHSTAKGKLIKVGCFSQADNQSPYSGYATVFACHAYTKWSNWNGGWRNLTTTEKHDFVRPPNAVTNLSASTDSDLTVHLNWAAVADAPGQGAHHYNVYRSAQAITQETKAAAVRISNKALTGGAPGSGMGYDDITCQPNTTYYYAVVACDSENNESFVSNCVQAALGADITPPATVGDQTVVQVDGTYNVRLAWHDPGDNVNVTQYKVYRKPGLVALTDGDIVPGNILGVAANPVADTSLSADGSADANSYSLTDTTTQLGQDYSYAVMAVDAAGNVSHVSGGSSLSVSIVDPAPAVVTTLTAKPLSREMKAQLTWTAPGNQGNISGYNVYRKAGSALDQADLIPGNLLTTVAGLSYTTDLTATGTDYYFAVTAVDESSGKESKLGNNALANVPLPPSALSAARLFNSVLKLSWTAPAYTTDIRNYKLYVRRNSGNWTQMGPADNLASNGSFETDLTGWTASSLTAVKDSSNSSEGISSVRLTTTSAGDRFLESSFIAVFPSTSHTYTGYVYVPVALTGGTTALRVIEYNSSGGYVTEHIATGVAVTSGWQQLTDSWTTSATTAKVKLRLQLSGIGTVYWDDVRLTSPVAAGTSARLDFIGFEPGNYEVAVTANYGAYGGSTPYESILSASAQCVMDDTAVPDNFTASGALTPASNYTTPNLAWNAPADLNFTGYTPSGLSCYRIQSSYDQGKTWLTILRTKLTNPGFETHTGTADDTTTDTFTGWGSSATYIYAVTDKIFDSKALKIRYTGSGDRYVYSAEPALGQTVANRTYSMSFWAKANKGTTFQYYIQANGGNNEIIGTVSPSIGTEWQRFTTSGMFSSGAAATSAKVVIRPSADTSAEITLDGVRLEADTGALLANDGSFYQPANFGIPGSAQSFDDPSPLVAGTSARYRIQAVDAAGNISGTAATNTIFAKPAVISDLTVTGSQTSSANVLIFSTPATLAGLSSYKVYGKEQGTALGNLNGATLLGTMTPAINHGGNIAAESTPSASHTYSTSYPVSNVVDGSTSSYWYGKNGVGPNSLTLTFGSAVPVYRVALSFYSSTYYCPKDYLIQTYDGSAWVTRITVIGDTSTNPAYTFTEPVSTNQIRIYITETRGGIASYRPIIGEFMVYPGDKFTHNLQNTALMAEVGHTYAYAVIAEDINAMSSDISGGPVTVRAIQDKDAPDKVTDLNVTSPVGTTQVMLNWSTPLDNLGHGSTGATGYEIYRLPTGLSGTPMPVTDSNFTTASLVFSGTYASSQAGTQNSYIATWYDHEGVNYAVRSRDTAGNWSPISNSPFIVVGKDTQAPTPPVITDCIPVDSPEVDVYWTAAVDNIGINGYRMFRADVNVEPFLTDKCITENNIGNAEIAVNLISYYVNSAADEGGTPGNTYYYALRAWDDENNMSNISNCAVATVRTTGQDTTPPTWSGTPLTAIQLPYPDIDLIWTSAADLDDSGGAGTIDHYEIYRSMTSFSSTTDPGVSKIATVSGIRNSYTDRTGEHEATYYYALTAVDAATALNRSSISNIASAQVAVAPSPDNTPPTVPGALSVSTGVYPNINISWTASTDVDDAGTPQQLLYYKLYRSLYPLDITDANKQNPVEVDTVIMACDAISYAARGIGGTQYNYRLEAFDMAGNGSGLSSQLMGQVAPAPCVDTTPPYAPADLNATIGPSPDIDLSWTASIDNGGGCAGQIDHYLLYKANYEITAEMDLRSLPHIYVAGNSTSFTDSTGAPNTQYWYVLTAVDTSANESARSNILTRTTGADTMAPASVADLKATPGVSAIELTWCRPSDNVGIDHYDIYRKEQGSIMTDADLIPSNKVAGFANNGVCLSYSDTGVLAGHTYSYAVIAVDGSGNRSTISRGQHDGDTVGIMP
jgi:predicted CXXCH cytochrome family protein